MSLNLKVGDKFSELTLVEFLPKSKTNRTSWLCMCSCGNPHTTDSTRLTKGLSKTCRPCSDIKSGESRRCDHRDKLKSKEYRAWSGMKNRCNNPKYELFHRYGGRGIEVCYSWKISFESFINDMGEAPSKSHSLDRIDNDKGYSKQNCRWTTSVTQGNNRSDNVMLTYNNKTQTIAQWCKELSLSYEMVRARLKRGHSVEVALSLGGMPLSSIYRTPAGDFTTIKEAAEHHQVKGNTASNRFASSHYKGWDKVKVSNN